MHGLGSNHIGTNQGCQIFIGTIYQNEKKYTKLPHNIPTVHKTTYFEDNWLPAYNVRKVMGREIGSHQGIGWKLFKLLMKWADFPFILFHSKYLKNNLLKEPEFCQLFKPKKGTKKFVLQSIEKD
jgi:hypothetical protein